jgi:hypothetical protein
MAESGKPLALTCARCGAAFACGAATGACWCFEQEFRLPMPPAGSAEKCLCASCLRADAQARPAAVA